MVLEVRERPADTMPVMMTNISISTKLADFLRTRIAKDDKDAHIARAFYSVVRNYYDVNAHDFFDLTLVDGRPRITYTTDAKYITARENGYSGSQWAHGVGWRIAGKPATVAQRLTNLPADEYGRGYDLFTQMAVAFLTIGDEKLGRVSVVSGDRITYYYDEDRHCQCSNLGDLGTSCMRYSCCGDRFGIYEDNAKLVTYRCDCGGLRARALLWVDVDNKRWYDRVYGTTTDQEVIRLWAEREGYSQLWFPGTHSATTMQRVTVTAPWKNYVKVPYLDSLPHWCQDCGTLSNGYCENYHHSFYELRNHETGYLEDTVVEYCPHCEATLDADGGCPNQKYCAGCQEYYCSTECPNGCIACPSCLTAYRPDYGPECDCIACDDCGEVNREVEWRRVEGYCPDCGYDDQGDGDCIESMAVQPVQLTWMVSPYDEGAQSGACPTCQRQLVYYLAQHTGQVRHCGGCGQGYLAIVASALPAIPIPPPRGTSPNTRTAITAVLQTAARRRLTPEFWAANMNTAVYALYATYSDEPPSPRLDERGGAMTDCDCHMCTRRRRGYDEREREGLVGQ
jgi:hypothetical protein